MIEVKQQHRSLVLFSGDHSWCRDTVARVISEKISGKIPWISDTSPENFMHLPAPKVKQLLGQEFSSVVFDAHDGFDADAFGAVSGTIRGGGHLLLLAPPLRDWPDYEDPDYKRLATWPYDSSEIKGLFLKRLAGILQSDDTVTVITP